MMKKNLKKLKKFFKSKAGLAVMFLVVLPLFALSATVGAVYFNNLSKPIPASSSPGGIVPLVTTPTSKPQTTNLTDTTAKQNTQSIGGASSSSSTPNLNSGASKLYVAPVCIKTVLPFTTSYRVASYLGAGLVQVIGGYEGYTKTCSADSYGSKSEDVYVQPVYRIISVGDGGASISQPIHTGETYDQIYPRVSSACDELARVTNNNPVANQWCVSTIIGGIMRYFGY